MRVTAGPDGFLAMEGMADYASHALLTEHLLERQATGGAALERLLPRLRKTAPGEQVALIRAVHARIAWLGEHEKELSEPKRWQDWLAQLLRNLYSPKLSFAVDDLVLLLEGHRQHRALWSFGPEELIVQYLETRELTPALATELRRFAADLQGMPGGMKYQSQAGYQSALQQVHMALWHDEGDALDPERCWSDGVRGAYRAMTGERRAKWRALLRHIKANAPVKPAKSWVKEAEALLARVGVDDFRASFAAWLAPMQEGKPQRLSVAGSHVLRGLLWYAALAKDEPTAETALVLLDTNWKAKRNIDKAMVALTEVLQSLPPAKAWPSLLRLQQEWPTTSIQVERLLKKTAAEFGITEEELKARALLKPKLDISEQVDKRMEKLYGTRAAVRVPRKE